MQVRVTDAMSHQALPCRITVADGRGSLVPLLPAAGQSLAARAGVIYTSDGQAAFGVAAGEYTIYATRGPEYSVAERKVTLKAGGAANLAMEISRDVPTPGFAACDTHIHTFTYSKHGDASSDDRVLTLAGEGIELAIASDHNAHVDYSEAAFRLKVADYFTYVIGNEVTTPAGHFIAFPVASTTTALPDSTLKDWPALMKSVRSVPNIDVVVLNHPRDTHNNFVPFAPANFNPVTGDNLRGPEFTFDAIEVCNSGTLQSDFMQSFHDWFALLNHGYHITAVGSSDSHDVSRFIVGQGRTYIACDDAKPGPLDVTEAVRNLKAGHALVSMGLLTELTVDGKFGPGDLAAPSSDEIRVDVRVLGPKWTSADRVELFANGERIREQAVVPTDATEKASIAWRIPKPTHDVHLIAIASGPPVNAPCWAIPLPYQPTGRSRERHVIGATNPVWLDADGDGEFTSPRAYAEKVIAAHATDPAKLVPALAGYDEAASAQAASLCQSAGGNIRSAAFQSALSSAAQPVRGGFAAFATTLPRE